METSNDSWGFLKAPRFWALVIGAISVALFTDGFISQAWVTAIGIITGGFVTVRTVDRFGENINSTEKIIWGSTNDSQQE